MEGSVGTPGSSKPRTCSQCMVDRRKDSEQKAGADQDRVSKKVLGASRSVAGVGVQGDLGWKKLEAQKKGEEKKMLYGRRVERST